MEKTDLERSTLILELNNFTINLKSTRMRKKFPRTKFRKISVKFLILKFLFWKNVSLQLKTKTSKLSYYLLWLTQIIRQFSSKDF